MTISDKELNQILEAIIKAKEKAGKKVTHAVLVENIDEKGEIKGKVLVDKTEKH